MIDQAAAAIASASSQDGLPHTALGREGLLPQDPVGNFPRNYNRTTFGFTHELKDHPLFDLPRLVEYSGRLPHNPKFAYWSNGSAHVTDRWDKPAGCPYSLQDTIAHIAQNDSLVLLKRVELDPEYGPLTRAVLDGVLDLVGPALRDDVIIGRATLLIASPHRVTSYHLDSNTNFLFQIRGDKHITVFDQTDRTLLSDAELERYYSGDINGAVYRESRQADGRTYDFKAGIGIHIPCMAPHWAKNSAQVSIAMSINFDLHSIARLGRIYRMNHKLRRLGLTPTPPGNSPRRDAIKIGALRGMDGVRALLNTKSRPPDSRVIPG